MNKSEQLIACLEGEIAKRDEELAACRVAVENCELFRARIAELEARQLLERAWRALANSATGREIGAYLDADPCAPECAETCARAAMCSTCSAVLSAQSPAGVDGWEVECAATYVSEFMRAVPSGLVPLLDGDQLCRLSDAKAIIDGLRGEVERLQRAEKNDAIAYKAAIERQGELRTERDQHAQLIGELEGLLREVRDTYRAAIHWEDLRGTMKRIDAALSAGKYSEQ